MDSRKRLILKVFRKYSYSLSPDVIQFLEEILIEHEIEDADIEYSLETLAKEYSKQDDAEMKISLEILQRVYQSLQDSGQRPELEKEILDPDSHLYFVDAFEMPRWHWSSERGTFERVVAPLTVSGSPESRVMAVRNRLDIIKQCVLRNEHFAPSTLPSRDRERLVTLRSTKQLLGRPGERFLLLGMLAHNQEGKICLEDADGSVVLDFSKLDEPGDGLFTEGCFALVEGEYTNEATLEIIAIGQPPCEPREVARSIYGHIDFLGKGSTSLMEDTQWAIGVQNELPDLHFFFLSDVWLDHPRTLPGLQKLLDNCIENNFIPRVIVLCGNFTTHSLVHGDSRDLQRYQESFDSLADLIASYPLITRGTHFVFVPGPLDLTVNSVLPRMPIMSSFTTRLRAKIPKVYFASNPCRIKFFNQELIVFREDVMSRMLRNIIGVKPNVRSDDLKRYLVQSILDQGHLCPLTINIQPVLPDYDHTMRLYPLPTAVILADKYDSYKITYTGCHVFNPGRFIGSSYTFSTYKPAESNSEECVPPTGAPSTTLSFLLFLAIRTTPNPTSHQSSLAAPSMAIFSFPSFLQLLGILFISNPQHSLWTSALLWIVRIATWSLLLRTYFFPWMVSLLSKHIRIQSLSFRSVRGLYVSGGSQTWRIDRVTYAWRSRRLQIKIYNLKLEFQESKRVHASPPRRHIRHLTLADFAPSPMAYRLWSLLSSTFALFEPYLRPLVRVCVVAALRVFIGWLPAIAEAIEFDLYDTALSPANMPKVQLIADTIRLHTNIKYTHIASRAPSVDTTRTPWFPISRPQYGMAILKDRLSAGFKRSLNKAWGATQVTVTLNLLFEGLNGVMPAWVATAAEDTAKFFSMPGSMSFDASVRFNPQETKFHAHSLTTILKIGDCTLDLDGLRSLLQVLQEARRKPMSTSPKPPAHTPSFLIPEPGHTQQLCDSPTSTTNPQEFPLPSTKHVRNGSNSPLLDAVSSLRGSRRQALRNYSKLRNAKKNSILSTLKAFTIELSKISMHGHLAQSEAVHGVVESITFTASLSNPLQNPLHCRWLGKSHYNDCFDPDAYDVRFSTRGVMITMEESGPASLQIPLLVIQPLKLQLLLSQWPSPWLQPGMFLANDPNAALLVIDGRVDGVQCTESFSHLSKLVASLPRQVDDPSQSHPQYRLPVPRLIVNLQCGPVAAQLVQCQAGSPDISALEARTDGFVIWLTSRFDEGKHPHPELIAFNLSTFYMGIDYSFVLKPLFVRARTKGASELIHMHTFAAQDPAYMEDPAFLSMETLEVTGYGRGVATSSDGPDSHSLLDVTSLTFDMHCSADAICFELWHPGVINYLSLLGNLVLLRSKPRARRSTKKLTVGGFSAVVTIPRFVVFVTSPDLNPNDAMELSRGFAFHSGISVQYSAICPQYIDHFQHHSRLAQLREELLLPPLPISSALGASKGANCTEEATFLRASLFEVVVRSAVSTKLFPDDPFIAERDDPRFIQQEFLRIPSARIDVRMKTLTGVKSYDTSVVVPYILGTFKISHVYNAMIATRTLNRLTPRRDSSSDAVPRANMQLQLNIATVQIMWILPTERLVSRFDSIAVSHHPGNSLKINWTQLTVSLRRPKHINRWDSERGEKWVEALSLQQCVIAIDYTQHPIRISLDLDAARFRIPFGFVMADFILDCNLTFKAIRHLVHTLAKGILCRLPEPEAEDPKRVPIMTFQIGCLSLEAADDPLESRLSIIWRTGSSAVLQRMEREEAFAAKVAAIIKAENAESGEIPTMVEPGSDYTFTAKHTVSIEDAHRRLQDVHALDYAFRLQMLKDRCAKAEDAILRRLRSGTRGNTAIPDFVRVESPERVAPLFRALFMNFYLHVTPPSFPLEHLPDYMHTQGAGLPKNTKFSLLVPMHLALTVSSLRVALRDYPLPLFAVPPHQDTDLPSLQLTTDFVIAEEMGTEQSVEWFDVVVLDPDDGTPGVAPLHFFVPKTILPVKMYANPDLQITSEGITSFSWGVSYGPAIQDLMRVIEGLSSPPRDPSPVVGFWDKMRLVLHGSLRASFAGEVRLHVKGSRDPYCIDDVGAGFVFAWKGDPQLLINCENTAHEFLQVRSDSMFIAIPDLKHDLPSAQSHKAARPSTFKKVCAKFRGGTCFGIGFVPEGSCGSECANCLAPHKGKCRLFNFLPHYAVKLELKDAVPAINSLEDSYRGFRSQYVHMSVSLTSAINQQHTSNFHLTPKAFTHFWAWWSLFDSTLSLPIRQGSFFPARHVTPKLGRHLATLKYRIVVPHLFVLHAYVDDSYDTWVDGVTPWVGVKGLFENFLVDMHQREEVSEVPGATPDTTKLVRHKPFYTAEVVLKGAEIRALCALFDEVRKKQIPMDADYERSSYRLWEGLPETDSSSVWYDIDDFIEIDWIGTSTPVLHLLPVAKCPWVTYFKRNAPKVGTQTTHSRFGNEDTHACILGQEPPVTEIQMSLASTRLAELEQKIRTSQLAGKDEVCHGQPLQRMADLLKEYIKYLANPQPGSPTTSQYRMASETFSLKEWDEFENVYQIHCPQIFLDGAIRDIMIRYYYCSRERKGFEYHMAERAVKFIRDQADMLPNLTTLERSTQGPKEAADIATSTFRRMFKGEFGRGSNEVQVESKPLPLVDRVDPLHGWSEGVALRKAHCCLLLKPQVVLRAESESSVCIVAAMQSKLQTYAIMDSANASDPVSGKIMSRNYASVSGLQVFAPTTSQSANGCLPLEVLIDYRCESNDFDRLVPQTEAAFHYDKFNRLRLRNLATSTRTPVSVGSLSNMGCDHLSNQTDLIRVHVPRFQVTAKDEHFKSIQRIVTQLLLFSDAAHKTRLDKLQTLYFTYDFTDLVSAADVVAGLQGRLRVAMETERNARLRLHYQHHQLNQDGLELLQLRAHIYMLADKLSLVFEAIKMAQDQGGEDASQKSALLLHASSSEISWNMLDQGPDLLAKLVVRDTHFSWLNRQDSSTVNNLEIGDMQAFDGSRHAVWTEILSKYNETGSNPMQKKGLFLAAEWVVLAPVNGIAVYETFDLSLHPLRLQIDAKVGRRIMEYVWPARRNRRSTSEETQPPSPEPPTPTTAQAKPASARASLDSPRALHGPGSSPDHIAGTLAPPPLRRLGVSRSFTDLRSASGNLQLTLHQTQSTDALNVQTALQPTIANEGRFKHRTHRKAAGAAEMKTRSTQKSFVRVRVASFNLLLSIAKEGSFECRDAKIKTRDLEYRNQTWSFEDLVNQFIPSDMSWRGWVKMAFHQPLVPVIPVARELITKTKWIKGGVQVEDGSFSAPFNERIGERNRDALGNSRQRAWKLRTRPQSPPAQDVQTVVLEPEGQDHGQDQNNDGSAPLRPRTRVLSLFKRSNTPRNDAPSSNEEQRPMGVPQHLASIFAAPEAVSASTTMPGGSTLQIEKSAPATIAEYATKTLPALRSRSSSRVQAHCLRTVRDSQGFLTAPRANSTGPIIFNPSDTASLSPIVSRPAFMDGTEHHEEVVDYLDVIDPQVGTVSGLTNAANALLFPPFQSLSRKPTLVLSPLPNDQGDGRSSIYNENTLDRHVEDILSRPSKFRRTLLGILSFIQTPMGIVTAVYGFLVVFWGAAIVMFASKIIDLHDPGLQGFWIEVSSQIVNASRALALFRPEFWTPIVTFTSGAHKLTLTSPAGICKIWHYKGRTKAFRAKAGLPQLSDVDDLPDPAYDSNYVHVLTEEEQRDLHQQQVKFQHHQTWYRPHGTETHRAFPIK
ncbi:hypothetical protein AX16_000986 [Volvariella volvacea WC 439]|nr:hypothetical protein AX16_000986 [Volvariella volvacea WC 439]